MKRSFIVEHMIIYTIQKDTNFLCSDKQKIYGDKIISLFSLNKE